MTEKREKRAFMKKKESLHIRIFLSSRSSAAFIANLMAKISAKKIEINGRKTISNNFII